MRRLKFQQITDSRFDNKEKLLNVLEKRMKEIETKLSGLPGVEVMRTEPYKLDLDRGDHIQYRVTYYIQKQTKKVTWDHIMGIVNSVKAVPYDWIN